MDGTFLTLPPQFAELYTVHGLSQIRSIIGAYGLLPNERLDIYNKFMTQISNLTNHVNPQSIMIDIYQSIMATRDQVYPIYKCVQVEGCHNYIWMEETFAQTEES